MVRERRGRRILGAVAIFLTAIALQQACTRAWGQGTGPDGSHYELSVVGLSRSAPGGGPLRTDCRWWPRYGDATLCGARAGGETPYGRLRLAYPLLQVALWLAVASLLLQTLRVPRHRLWQGAAPAAVSAMTITGILFVMRAAQQGLGALDQVTIQFGSRGFVLAVVAALLSAFSAIVAFTPEPSASDR